MAANTGKLAGRTLFISGASRGIGLAIAKKAAKDGANVVIAAKTVEPHPKLPGTIYTAAKEIEVAGGRCLPCIVDIRNEEQVQTAVENAVKQFGGIDVLINNASAISMTGTEATGMKKYDLMNQVNARGTYLCSRACLPYLKKGTNPHILNISPPLNMNPMWFKNHVAYTMAKYGMSMCVLGMAEELKEDGIAVNAIWPRTAIYTAAMEMLGGGQSIKESCRKVDIMADAAYVMLTNDSKTYTGNFAIDDEVLQKAGVTDFAQYDCVPGNKLMPDFFLDIDPGQYQRLMKAEGIATTSKAKEASPSADSGPAKIFDTIKGTLSDDIVKSINGIYAFNLTGEEEGNWWLDMKNESGSVGQGELPSGKPDVTFTMSSDNFTKMFMGQLKPTMAFMTGKMKIKGDMGLAMKLEKLMGKMQSKL